MKNQKYERLYAEINLDAVRYNMEMMRKNIGEAPKLCAVVKADGYGHGAVPVAKTVANMVWGFAVATAEEGVSLRRHGIDQPILCLGYIPKSSMMAAVTSQIRFCAYREEAVRELSEAAVSLNQTAYVHVKVDTGMGRLGVTPEEAVDFVKKIQSYPKICVEGIFTHLATADMTDKTAAYAQADRFRMVLKELEREQISIPIRHCGNSAAILEMTDIAVDMMRAGISIYGMYPSDEVSQEVTLEPVMSLHSTVSFVKTLPKGMPIGYGGTYVTEKETRVATIPTGYADGYPRSLSNCGYVLIHGKKAFIVGRVCMDQFMVDVSAIPDVKEGDPVVLVGTDGAESISVEELAALAGSFNYEFVCDISKRVPRVYRRNGAIVGTKDYFEDEYTDFLN